MSRQPVVGQADALHHRSWALGWAALVCLLAAGQTLAGDDAPFVDSKTTKARFKEITAKDMDMLRGKKILFASRSFGLNLCNGLRALAKEDKKYEFLSSYQRYDVFKAGGDLSVIPADAFAKTHFVHFLATYWPHTKRVEEVDTLLRQKPHEFGKTVDAVIIYFHTARANIFDTYAETMDKLRADFPHVRFIYVTAGFMAAKRAKDNEEAHKFSEKVRAAYKGKVPVYDLGAILSDDFRVGHAYCPEYSKDPAGVHPNLDAGQTMMAKGFLLVLRDAFRMKAGPGGSGSSRHGKTLQEKPLAKTHPEYKAVRAILDANGLTKKTVESVSVVEKGHVVELYLQEGGIKSIPAAIGKLTRLRVLHVYGDRNLPHPLLESIDPAIGKCTGLQDLLLNHNELKTLPKEIARLTKLKSLSLADNRLQDLPARVQKWAERFDPEGLKQQKKE